MQFLRACGTRSLPPSLPSPPPPSTDEGAVLSTLGDCRGGGRRRILPRPCLPRPALVPWCPLRSRPSPWHGRLAEHSNSEGARDCQTGGLRATRKPTEATCVSVMTCLHRACPLHGLRGECMAPSLQPRFALRAARTEQERYVNFPPSRRHEQVFSPSSLPILCHFPPHCLCDPLRRAPRAADPRGMRGGRQWHS